ncbi:Inositol hexakisphosphate kinase 3 [Gracilariopsis chorda]|uniref:Kinase n=1 Tax=Gracilariopsis chorda TaxID=448386 RepID=A0A2V3IG80_9FLOR|nr:Inositol hexakisphosphate kinase 3 [Gracilariopsis chorda]|eukprot:PXF41052.1 Inositol hexakisphosphate kinase 3 [Gracilariopsis chorda]
MLYPIQVGGHRAIRSAPTPDRVLKPLSQKELAFYRRITAPDLHPHLHWLRKYTPAFYGTATLPQSPSAISDTPQPPEQFLELEDLNFPFRNPSVLDVKLGFRHYDDDATPEKRLRQIQSANSTTTAETGLVICGMRTFKSSVPETCSKHFGKTLKPHQLPDALYWFFHDGTSLQRTQMQQVLSSLRALRSHFASQTSFFFYSSSLLIVYDSNPPASDVRMIDFAHTVPSEGHPDTGYLKALDNLITVLETALQLPHAPNLPSNE